MEIKNSGSIPSPISTPNPQLKPPLPGLANSRVGETLQAVVIKVTEEQSALLKIGAESLRVETTAPLRAGQRIGVEVVQLNPKPILRLPVLPFGSTPPSAEQVINSALKQALPKQSGLAPLLANLNALSQAPQLSATLAPLVKASIKKVVDSIAPRSQTTHAAGLKKALRASGLFLENRLANGTAAFDMRDLKATLLQLMTQTRAATQNAPSAALSSNPQPAITAISPASVQATPPALPPIPPQRSAPPQPPSRATSTLNGTPHLRQILGEISRQTEGALARLVLHQLASLPQQDQTTPSWTFELPVQDREKTDLFQFTIQEEGEGEKKKKPSQPRYTVTLSFDLEGLGAIHAKINYAHEQINATLWAEEQTTARLVQKEIRALSQRLEYAGVVIGQLHCQHGTPPAPVIHTAQQTVLDISV